MKLDAADRSVSRRPVQDFVHNESRRVRIDDINVSIRSQSMRNQKHMGWRAWLAGTVLVIAAAWLAYGFGLAAWSLVHMFAGIKL